MAGDQPAFGEATPGMQEVEEGITGQRKERPSPAPDVRNGGIIGQDRGNGWAPCDLEEAARFLATPAGAGG